MCIAKSTFLFFVANVAAFKALLKLTTADHVFLDSFIHKIDLGSRERREIALQMHWYLHHSKCLAIIIFCIFRIFPRQIATQLTWEMWLVVSRVSSSLLFKPLEGSATLRLLNIWTIQTKNRTGLRSLKENCSWQKSAEKMTLDFLFQVPVPRV